METPIERDELKRLEAQVDAWRGSIPLPAWGRQQAQWNLLSVTEDQLRLRMLKVQEGTLELDQYNQWIDVHKYMLKYALEYIERLPVQTLVSRPALENDDWGRAHELLEAHAT